jgi:hypothetical protein
MTPKGKRAKKRGAPQSDARSRPRRGPDRRQTVLRVVCEGVTERDYFGHLEDEYGEDLGFHIIRSPKNQPATGYKPGSAVEWAVEERRRLRGSDRDNVWAVFDRDEHTGIAEAIRWARDNGIRVAFSTPSFDLWLWLHLAPGVPPRLSGDNEWVVKQLRTVAGFRNYAKRSGGRDSDDRPKHLNGRQLAALHDKQRAVELARRLVKSCPSGSCDPAGAAAGNPGHAADCDVLRRDTATDVYLILESLGIVHAP